MVFVAVNTGDYRSDMIFDSYEKARRAILELLTETSDTGEVFGSLAGTTWTVEYLDDVAASILEQQSSLYVSKHKLKKLTPSSMDDVIKTHHGYAGAHGTMNERYDYSNSEQLLSEIESFDETDWYRIKVRDGGVKILDSITKELESETVDQFKTKSEQYHRLIEFVIRQNSKLERVDKHMLHTFLDYAKQADEFEHKKAIQQLISRRPWEKTYLDLKDEDAVEKHIYDNSVTVTDSEIVTKLTFDVDNNHVNGLVVTHHSLQELFLGGMYGTINS